MAQGLGIIGNCSYNALLRDGSVEWLCWPRPDSSFVFGPLLDRERGGAFAVEGVDADEVRQEYVGTRTCCAPSSADRTGPSSFWTSLRGSRSTTGSSSPRCSPASCAPS